MSVIPPGPHNTAVNVEKPDTLLKRAHRLARIVDAHREAREVAGERSEVLHSCRVGPQEFVAPCVTPCSISQLAMARKSPVMATNLRTILPGLRTGGVLGANLQGSS